MYPVGNARSLWLDVQPSRIVPSTPTTQILRLQPQGGDICIRVDGSRMLVNGFIIPSLQIFDIPLNETKTIYAWTVGDEHVRVVIQDYTKEAIV